MTRRLSRLFRTPYKGWRLEDYDVVCVPLAKGAEIVEIEVAEYDDRNELLLRIRKEKAHGLDERPQARTAQTETR